MEFEHGPITAQNKAAIAATSYGAFGIYAYSLADHNSINM